MLPGHRLGAAGLVSLLSLDSVLGGVSIALILPLSSIMLGTTPAVGAAAKLYDVLESAAHALGHSITAPLLLLFFAAVLLGKAVLSFFSKVAGFWYSQAILHDWLDRLFASYIRRDVSVAQTEMRGHAINIVSREIHQAFGYIVNDVTFSAALIAFLVQFVIMSLVNINIVIAGSLVGLLMYFAVFRPLVKMSHRVGVMTLDGNKSMIERFVQTLNNLRDVKLLQLEDQKIAEVQAANLSLHRLEMKFGIIRSAPSTALELFFALGIAAFGVAISFYSGDEVNRLLGETAFFVVGTYRLVGFASTMTTEWVRRANRKSSFDAVMVELQRLSVDDAEAENLPIDELRSDIEIRNLSYATGTGEPIFSDASGRILRGRINVIYGGSGSGKTTLLDLLTRLREPPAGAIFANGQDATRFLRDDWMPLFGYVSQEPTLFAGTLRDNIVLGRKTVEAGDVEWALEHAMAHEFVNAKNSESQFWVEEGGVNLSGGQRRRIAIARALATRPDVLILDEATQGVEIGVERDLMGKLARTGLTIIVVSHRLETAELADQILHLKDGRLSVVASMSELESLSAQRSRVA